MSPPIVADEEANAPAEDQIPALAIYFMNQQLRTLESKDSRSKYRLAFLASLLEVSRFLNSRFLSREFMVATSAASAYRPD